MFLKQDLLVVCRSDNENLLNVTKLENTRLAGSQEGLLDSRFNPAWDVLSQVGCYQEFKAGSQLQLAGSHAGCSIIPDGIPPGTHLGSQVGLVGSHLIFLLSINYDENIILSWMKNFMGMQSKISAQVFLISSLSSLSEVVTGIRYVK